MLPETPNAPSNKQHKNDTETLASKIDPMRHREDTPSRDSVVLLSTILGVGACPTHGTPQKQTELRHASKHDPPSVLPFLP